MGLFDFLQGDERTGAQIVTKTVQGKNTEVGRKKLQLVNEMRALGYELVNEIAESGVVEGFFGDSAGTRYTLTFQLNEQLAAEIKANEEKRRKEEAARALQERKEAAAQAKREKEDEERRYREYEEKISRLKEPLGSGWSVVVEGGKNAKRAVKAIDALIKEQKWNSYMKKLYFKELKTLLKKNGRVYVLNDYGENICKMFCDSLNELKCGASVSTYDEEEFAKQSELTGMRGILDAHINNILSENIHTQKPTSAYKKLLAVAAGKKAK